MANKKPDTKTKAKETEVENKAEIEEIKEEASQVYNPQTIISLGLEERLWLEDRHNRILYLDNYVNNDILHTLILQIAKFNGEDYGKPIEQRIPITLIINSGGGEAFIGMALVNAIQNSETPVIGVCLGLCASMAFGIFAVCHTRVSVPDAVFMVHDGSAVVADNITKVKDYAKFLDKLDERYNRAIASRTKFTVKELQGIAPHDNWFFADELVDMGMVDGIIGKDVGLGEIFEFMKDEETEDAEDCDCEECKK